MSDNGHKMPVGVSAIIAAIPMLVVPMVVFAQTFDNILILLINVFGQVISLLLGVAVAVFFWGLVKFIYHADDERAREEGKNIIVWGMIALFVMVALWGIVGYIQRSIFGALASPQAIELPPNKVPTTL